jgi:hypothetical protein
MTLLYLRVTASTLKASGEAVPCFANARNHTELPATHRDEELTAAGDIPGHPVTQINTHY